MADLEIDTHKNAGVVQVALTGEFDLAGLPRFEERIAAVESEVPKAIVIDLTGLRFMDSSGLRALVTADDRARKQQRRLAIVPGPPEVRRVFEITKLDTRLDLVENASAVAG
jgi:anti-sigma B factor antagonist